MADRAPDLRPLLAPRSIAVVGASEGRGAGPTVLGNLRQLGYAGEVYPVNPRYRELAGWRCYPSLDDVPGPVDTVAILLSSGLVLPILRQASDLGIRAAWALASGFAEAGPGGVALQREVAAFARERGIALCGPNCIGMVNVHARAATYSTALPASLRPGHVGGVIQSGAVCLGLVNSNRGLGFSTIVSTGNEAVLDNADYIAYLADDPQTKVIVAFIEGFRRPDGFVEAAERARAAGKPLLVVKVGRSAVAQRATVAHTGSLAGADAIHDAVFRRHGVVRLDSLDEMLEAAELFLAARLPRGRAVALLTLSGGQIGLIGDLARDLDLHLPELSPEVRELLATVLPSYSPIANPLDAWGAGNYEETYPACLEIVARDPAIDLVGVARDTSPGIADREVRQSEVIVDAAIRVGAATDKPVVVFANVSTGLEPSIQQRAADGGVPLLQGTRESLRAIEALVWYAEHRRGVAASSEEPAPVEPAVLARIREDLAARPGPLGEAAAKRILAAAGIAVTRESSAGSRDQAVVRAREIGYPVALKVDSADIAHKTEAGGVVLDLRDDDQVRRAFEQIMRSARAYDPEARVDGVTVAEMVPPDAIEAIVGSITDPEFGPVVVFGLGGVLVELARDSVLRLAPVTQPEALEMTEGIRAAELLRGFRGRPPADVAALADVIVRVSHLAAGLREEVAAIDINPLMILPAGRGVVAADALIVRREEAW